MTTPREADFERAPGLVDGATSVVLTARQANLAYWLRAVPQGTLLGRPEGHDPRLSTPDYMREAGPLRDALIAEYAFRSAAEEKATRALSYLVAIAPDTDTMEFYATQVLDEARHAMVFRNHLRAVGVPATRIAGAVERHAGPDVRAVLDPVEEFGLEVMRDAADFIGGVVVMTIIVEGALAPAAELSERKWRPLDPVAAEIDRGAGIDEIRHLTVGASVAREYLEARPSEKDRMAELIARGTRLWAALPVAEMVLRREVLFQEGLERHADVVADYEVWPGRRLVDTTPDERTATAQEWSAEMRASRLRYIGLEEAL